MRLVMSPYLLIMLLIPAVEMFVSDSNGGESGTVTKIHYLGCFESDHFYSEGSKTGPYATSSISECLQMCIGDKMKYAVLKQPDVCICKNQGFPRDRPRQTNSQCSLKCNPKEYCGGPNSMRSVFNIDYGES